ncbi:FecR domain-containing protein [Planctomicrobium piriforme]|uniref:FecR protein n=1 Tax=Planctomicrobium piriforme TaxID=1576369 RepID=A0A1I3RV07_9PLAN|nr:FecR domain-containing protein [Planctomicrobium piriforme]SFJ50414.1 FecR protein [Planctomicrobium piriforme]
MSPDSPELMKLIDLLLDGAITPEQHARLQSLLHESQSARKEYLSYLDIHLGLNDLEEHEFEVALPAGRLVASRAPQNRSQKWSWLWALTSVCGVLLVGGLAAVLSRSLPEQQVDDAPVAAIVEKVKSGDETPVVSPDSAAPAVHLTQAANAELLLEYVPAIGDSLRLDHEYVLLKGLLELTFQNGAVATLKSPSVFTVKSATRMEMKVGNCSVHAPDEAKGFELITPQSRVVDLGTRFSVVTNETGASDVQVVEGSVEVHPHEDDSQGSMLLEGEAVRLANAPQQSRSIEFDEGQYWKRFPDRVVSYTATEETPGEGVRDLLSVTTQRGGQSRTYPVEELVGIDVVHFSSFANPNNAACAGPIPDRIESLLSEDTALTSGLPNFSRAPGPYQPAENFANYRDHYGLAIRFRQPVLNGPGPDAVLFEVQSAEYPASGDSFHVSPIEDGPGLRTHFVKRFDVMLNSNNARKVFPMSSVVFESPIKSLDDFSRVKVVSVNKLAMPFYALAVGIDFSDLGYPEGASVQGLFFEDSADEEHVVADPVFIGGFPSSP